MSTPPSTDWVGRLGYAIRWSDPSRSQLWQLSLVVVIGLFFFALHLAGPAQQPGRSLETLGLAALQLAIICMAAGEFLYPRARTLAGLFWVVSFSVFFPSSAVLIAAHFFSQGTTLGFLVALFFPTLLLVSYGSILRRYRSSGTATHDEGNRQHAVMEVNWLDKTVWALFATRTKRRAVVLMVFGCILIVFALAFASYPLPLVIVCVLPLALILAGVSRLLHDNRRTLARLLEVVAFVLLAGFWVSLLVGIIIFRAPQP